MLAVLGSILILGCSSSDENAGSASGDLRSKCASMCKHLLAEPLLGCGKSNAASQDGCAQECYEHVTPSPDDGEIEATESELDCAIDAPTCEAWKDCGDFL